MPFDQRCVVCHKLVYLPIHIPDASVFCVIDMPEQRHLDEPWSLAEGPFDVPSDFEPRKPGETVRQLNVYDTKKRRHGWITKDGLLYHVSGDYLGEMAPSPRSVYFINSAKGGRDCRLEERYRVEDGYRVEEVVIYGNPYPGRVNPRTGLIYRCAGAELRKIGIVGKVSPQEDIFRMGAVASLLLDRGVNPYLKPLPDDNGSYGW